MWLTNRIVQRLGGGALERLSIRVLFRAQFAMLRGHKDQNLLGLIRQGQKNQRMLLTANEAFMVNSLATAQRNLGGERKSNLTDGKKEFDCRITFLILQ